MKQSEDYDTVRDDLVCAAGLLLWLCIGGLVWIEPIRFEDLEGDWADAVRAKSARDREELEKYMYKE